MVILYLFMRNQIIHGKGDRELSWVEEGEIERYIERTSGVKRG